MNTCSRILRDNAGLLRGPSEQTILAGVTKKSNSPSIVLEYVDDLLVGSLSPRGIQDIRGALEESLKVKTAGMITNASKEGGRITFLGRDIIRPNQSDRLLVRVPPNYLEELFVDDPFCQDLKGTPVPPDLFRFLRMLIAVQKRSRSCLKKLQVGIKGLLESLHGGAKHVQIMPGSFPC